MKKMFMAVIALMMTISASAQFYIYCSDGNVIKVDSISMVAPADEPDTPTEPEEPTNPSAGIGVFSVAEGRTVTFSKGNLQYTQSTDTWSFASAQWEMIGTDNVTGGSVESDPKYGNSKEGTALADKVDLFGWSTSTTNFGVSTSTDWENGYSGSFIDWGTNKIGNDAPNTWRTLTYEEWLYVVFDRPNASSLKGVAQVNGVNGLILLPDSWTCPSCVTFKSGFHNNYGVDYYAAYQTFTAAEWSKLEAAGAVFLPAAGRRYGSSVSSVQFYGYYWSATENISGNAFSLYFSSDEASMDSKYRDFGLSVRLVKDIEGEITTPDKPTEPDTPTEPEEPTNPSAVIGVFSVGEGKTVTFSQGNLQYTQSTNTWSFARAQWEMIGTDNVTGGSVYSDPQDGDEKYGDALADKVDLFGWSTSATHFGVSTSTDYNDYLGSFVDWGTNKIGNDAPNTWRTLTYDEWKYLLKYRPNASSLKGVAQVNGVNGFILLPDNWTCPADVTFKSGFHSEYSVEAYGQYQTFSADQWSKLEAAGAVFLPASGLRFGSLVYDVQYIGGYWSATEYNSGGVYFLYFHSDEAYMGGDLSYSGRSVRLVKDIEGEITTPDKPTEPDTPTEPEEPKNTENGHEYVDLGLSVKWATCNVGATKPEEYGDYFAWGETPPKSNYDWSTYKWCNGSYDTPTKYNTNSSYGTVDNKTTLDLSDDAARANWGGSWRMPTDAELTELREQCTWTWTTQNGVYGYKVTSKKSGYTNKSIFLPAAGYYGGSSLGSVGSYGYYWSSSLYSDDPFNAWSVVFYSGYAYRNDRERNFGYSVRPVCQ